MGYPFEPNADNYLLGQNRTVITGMSGIALNSQPEEKTKKYGHCKRCFKDFVTPDDYKAHKPIHNAFCEGKIISFPDHPHQRYCETCNLYQLDTVVTDADIRDRPIYAQQRYTMSNEQAEQRVSLQYFRSKIKDLFRF